ENADADRPGLRDRAPRGRGRQRRDALGGGLRGALTGAARRRRSGLGRNERAAWPNPRDGATKDRHRASAFRLSQPNSSTKNVSVPVMSSASVVSMRTTSASPLIATGRSSSGIHRSHGVLRSFQPSCSIVVEAPLVVATVVQLHVAVSPAAVSVPGWFGTGVTAVPPVTVTVAVMWRTVIWTSSSAASPTSETWLTTQPT